MNQVVREKSTLLVVGGGGKVTLRAIIGTLKVPFIISLKCPIMSFLNIKSLKGNTREQEFRFSIFFGKVQYFKITYNVLKDETTFEVIL